MSTGHESQKSHEIRAAETEMAESKESLANDELTEDEIVKIAQQIPGAKIANTLSVKQKDSTKKILEAIGSENEQSKLTDSIMVPSFTHSTKTSKHDASSPTDNVLQDKVNITPDLLSNLNNLPQENDSFSTTQNVINEPAVNYFDVINSENISSTVSPERKDSTTGEMRRKSFTVTSNENQTENNQTDPANEDQLTEMVPESMYSALQQRAQNVLKMIAEKKLSESSGPLRSKELGNIGSRTSSQSQTSPQQSVEVTNQLNEYTNLKTSNLGTKDSVGNKSSGRLKENTEPLSCIESQNKSELPPASVLQNKIPSKLIKGNKSETNNSVLGSESQQSTKSTEECTTDYSIRNKTESNTNQKVMTDKPLGKELKMPDEKAITGKISGPLQQTFSEHSTQAVFKELSQIIESNDMPEKLTKRGEIICYFFKQKLLSSLEASGTLDLKSAELVDITSSKFANWMENILKEIDAKKKKKATIDAKGVKEDTDEDEFVSASSSKESFFHKENTLTSQQEEKDEKPEVVKIQEISEEELKEKYGSYLEDETKHEVFNFVGPDEKSVEVKHLMIESNAKIMVVKKISSDSQQSIWVVEVGPDVTLDTVSGKVIKKTLKEESEKESITILKQGEWNLEKIGWENWLPKVLAAGKIKCRKIPTLKKQCKLRDSDFHAEYPTYSPSLLALGTMDQSLLDGNIIFPTPPQTEPSAPQQP